MAAIFEYLEMIDPVNWFTCFIGLVVYLLMETKRVQLKLKADPNRANFTWKKYYEENWVDYALSFVCSFGGMIIANSLIDEGLTPLYSGAIGTMGTWLWMTAMNIYRNYVTVKAGGQAAPPPNQQSDGQSGQ